MANSLTGDWEACVQVALRQIDGLLATLHQAGADKDAELKLLHSTTLRIGDPRRGLPETGPIGDWLTEYQRAAGPRGARDVASQLTANAPPGMAKVLSERFEELFEGAVLEDPPPIEEGRVRGLARVQLGSVKVSLLQGATAEIGVLAQIRAYFYPDPETTALPEPLHGQVRAGFVVRRARTRRRWRLFIEPSSQDSAISFRAAPGSGLSAADEEGVTRQVRKALREGFELLPVDLPSGFPFTEFKGVSRMSGGEADAIALPLQLSSAAPPATGTQGIGSFIGNSGFAFAVSEEFVGSVVDVQAIRASVEAASPRFLRATYRLRFSSGPTLTLHNGSIEVAGRIDATTPSWYAPNVWVSFKAQIGLVLDPASQLVSLERVGLEVDESWDMPHDTAVRVVREEIDKALPAQAPAIRRTFDDAKDTLLNGLKRFDAAASAHYTGVEVTPDGVIVRGELGGGLRRPAVVQVAETHRGTAFTAYDSWIPAGSISRMTWSWIEHTGPVPVVWGGVERSHVEAHRFVFPKPAGISSPSSVCLQVEGTSIGVDGRELRIIAGGRCRLPEPEIALDAPSWMSTVTMPVWQSDIAADAVMRDAVRAHVGIQRHTPQPGELRANAVVHFADWDAEAPLAALQDALRSAHADAPFVVVAVLPAGAFDARRKEFEAKLGWHSNSAARLEITEDHESGWTSTFAVEKLPATYLMTADGKLVHGQQGALDSDAFTEALRKHLSNRTAPPPTIHLAVDPGDPAPDIWFADDRGERGALHRFRRRGVIINFFQAWSSPCLTELARLQALHDDEKITASVVAFHGGQDAKSLDELRKELGLTFPLVHDAQHRVARRYGVRCWPTTITVGPDGCVEHIQLGSARQYQGPKDAGQSATAG